MPEYPPALLGGGEWPTLSPGACLREAASAKAGERVRGRGEGPPYGVMKHTPHGKGGGERVDGHSEKTQGTLYGYRTAFMEASQRQTDRWFKFRRQQTFGRYVVDFVNFEKKVVVELDGEQHALDPGDKIRDEWFRAEGYKVLRFWDNQVFSNLEGVLETIREVLLTPHPAPLPQGERGDNFWQ